MRSHGRRRCFVVSEGDRRPDCAVLPRQTAQRARRKNHAGRVKFQILSENRDGAKVRYPSRRRFEPRVFCGDGNTRSDNAPNYLSVDGAETIGWFKISFTYGTGAGLLSLGDRQRIRLVGRSPMTICQQRKPALSFSAGGVRREV